jgi:hypothetical protein
MQKNDLDYTNMTNDEIQDLFKSGQLHPESDEGIKAIYELASRDRTETKPVKKIAYWVFVVILIVTTACIIGYILSIG